jgi:hypothetical protein
MYKRETIMFVEKIGRYLYIDLGLQEIALFGP